MPENPLDSDPTLVDPSLLQEETLVRLAREFLLRESHEDVSYQTDMPSEIAKVVHRLKTGDCLITFDPQSETVGVVLAEKFRRL